MAWSVHLHPPLAWRMAYDPIVEGMHKAVGVPAPTYVDDLAGLVVGPRQALRASFYLLFGSWAAGLEVSPRRCRALVFNEDSPTALRLWSHPGRHILVA